MAVIDRALGAIGLTRLTREVAAALDIASRFASSDHLDRITLDDWLGVLPDYVAVTRENAMTVGTVEAIRNTVAITVGRLPLFAEQNGTRAALQPQLLTQAERGVPLATTMTNTVDELVFYKHAWWIVRERDFYGWPTWVEHPDRSRLTFDSKGRLTKIDGDPVNAADVIRFDSPLAHGLLHTARKDIQRAIALNISAALAEDNPVPTVELHNETDKALSDDEREALLDNWSSARRRRGVAYTPKGIKVIPHGAAAQQLLIDGRRAISLDLVRHANLPAWAASTAIDGATMTYDNRSLRNWELHDLGLAGYFTAIAGRLSMPDITPRGWRVRYDLDEFTRPDEKTRFETYKIGLDGGFIDRNWIATREGWPAPMGENP